MGSIYLARHTGPGGFEQLVVLKRIRPEAEGAAQVSERFLQEARITALLSHPNIVRVYNLELDGEQRIPYLVMEHVHGRSLGQIMDAGARRQQPVPVAEALLVGVETCKALQFAHTFEDDKGQRHRVIHRDVHPRNVLVSFLGQVKVIDFGLAKSRLSAVKTSTGVIKGTLAYMSPEQASGHDLDPRTDVFSLGVVLYELLTGEQPFLRDELLPTLRAIVEEEVPPPSEHRSELPSGLDDVLMKALQKQPGDRHQSAAELQRDLVAQVERLPEPTGEWSALLASWLGALFPGKERFRKPPTAESEQVARELALDMEPKGITTEPTGDTEEKEEGGAASADTDLAVEVAPQPVTVSVPGAPAPLSVVDDLPPRREEQRKTVLPWVLMGVVAVALLAALLWVGRDRTPGFVPRSVTPAPKSPSRAPPPPDVSGVATADLARAPDASRLVNMRRPKVNRRPSPAPVSARPASNADAAPRQTLLGTLQVRTALSGAFRERRIFRAEQMVRVGGAGAPFKVRLTCRLASGRMKITVDSTPWSIAYPAGLSPGRTPRAGILVGAATRRVDLKRPDGKEMALFIKFQIAP